MAFFLAAPSREQPELLSWLWSRKRLFFAEIALRHYEKSEFSMLLR